MPDRRTLEDILVIAVHAPSGDNAQPWRFKLNRDALSIFNLADRDATLYNFRQRGSYLAHGALVENIRMAAADKGFSIAVVPFPGETNCIATITFSSTAPEHDPLLDVIHQRATNRKPYKDIPLAASDEDALRKSITASEVSLKILDQKKLRDLASTISLNERFLFENRDLHNFLFGMIRWSEAEELKKPGLYVLTMEFPAPLRFLLKHVFCRWSIVTQLNNIGLSHAIPKQSAELYKASSAFGALIIQDTSDQSYFEAGQVLQKLWLTATRAGMSLQPITAIPYLAERVRAGEAQSFSEEHIRLISEADTRISTAFQLKKNERIAMLFRIGYGDAPSAHSAKLPPTIE